MSDEDASEDNDEFELNVVENRKRRLFQHMTTIDEQHSRLDSQHPNDIRIRHLANGTDELQPNELLGLIRHMNETRVLSLEDQESLDNVRRNLQQIVFKTLQQGRRYIFVIKLTFEMVDMPEYADRASGTVRCLAAHVADPRNLINFGRAVRDLVVSWGLCVYIELQRDILVDQERALVVQQANGIIDLSEPIASLYAVIPDVAALP